MQVNAYMRIIYKYYIENEFTKDVLLVIMVDDTREMNKKDSKKEENSNELEKIRTKNYSIVTGSYAMRGKHINSSPCSRCVSECRGRGCLPTGTRRCDPGLDVKLGYPWCDTRSEL